MTPEQVRALLATVERFNAACDWIGAVAFRERCANKVALQKIVYYDTRARFGLSAQLSIRAISKVVEAYKRDKTIQPRFRPHGAVPYDERIMSWKGMEHVSLLTLQGRIVSPIVFGTLPGCAHRQAARSGRSGVPRRYFYLYVTVEAPEVAVQDVQQDRTEPGTRRQNPYRLTGRQTNSSAAVLARLGAVSGSVERELHACQIELITGVHRSVGGAVSELAELRRAVTGTGAGLCGSGTHPSADEGDAIITDKERYERIQFLLGDAVVTPVGVFDIHVGMPDSESA